MEVREDPKIREINEEIPVQAEQLTKELLTALGNNYYILTGANVGNIGPHLGQYIYKFIEFRKKGLMGSRKGLLGSKPIFTLVGDKIRTYPTPERLQQAVETPYPHKLQGWIKGNNINGMERSKSYSFVIPDPALEVLNKTNLPLFNEGRDYGFEGISAEEYDPAAFIKGPLPPGFYD